MCVCVYVCMCVCGKFPSGLIKKTVRVTGLVVSVKCRQNSDKNRPVVSGLIDGFVPEM